MLKDLQKQSYEVKARTINIKEMRVKPEKYIPPVPT